MGYTTADATVYGDAYGDETYCSTHNLPETYGPGLDQCSSCINGTEEETDDNSELYGDGNGGSGNPDWWNPDWGSGGGGGGGSSGPVGDDNTTTDPPADFFNRCDAVDALNENVQPSSIGRCAEYVRKALEAGGVDCSTRPGSAKDYDTFLLQKGFIDIEKSGYSPQEGDIVVIESFTDKKGRFYKHGHIQMYNGNKWISDFEQRDFWAGPAYRECKPNYRIFRGF